MISGQPTQNVTGLFGEHLSISLQQIIDPADQILTQAGYRLDQGERALLVQTTIGNRGGIDYESLPDLYLVLVSSTGAVLQKAAMAVARFPAPPGRTAGRGARLGLDGLPGAGRDGGRAGALERSPRPGRPDRELGLRPGLMSR